MPTLVTPSAELCLEFANTVHWHASKEPMETLNSYSDLLDWALQNSALDDRAADRLKKLAEEQPKAAAKVFDQAIELREAIYRVMAAQVNEEKPEGRDLEVINDRLGEALAHARLAPGDAGFAWGWDEDATDLEGVLWPIVRSAADLLTAKELLLRVGQCADDRGCGWLFLDLSKNHSRRWCDINDCGNRAKQQRHRGRQRMGNE